MGIAGELEGFFSFFEISSIYPLIGHDRGRFLVTSSLLLLSSRPENEETDFLICDSLSLLSCIILNGNININWNYDDLSLKRYRILEFLFVFLEKIKEELLKSSVLPFDK